MLQCLTADVTLGGSGVLDSVGYIPFIDRPAGNPHPLMVL